MGKSNHLGDYLRARRGQVTPSEVGLWRARGAGLPDYGAMNWPCWPASAASTCNAWSRAATDTPPPKSSIRSPGHYAWTPKRPPTCTSSLTRPPARTTSRDAEQVSAAIAELIDQFPMPAIVVSRYQDVLAANPIARALSPGFQVGQNLSRWRVLDPAAKHVYADWDEATALAVGGLRELSADDPDDPRLRALIDELSSSSERFKQLWARADRGIHQGDHPHAPSRRRGSIPDPHQA